jgi:predicted SnoaL-like aldol condensation-catalyzing enzyme
MSQSSPERNKALVISFYEEALNDRNLSVVADFLAPYYRQHNPTIEDGVEGLRKYLRWIQETHPYARSKILRVYADGDFVILHFHPVRTPGTPGDASPGKKLAGNSCVGIRVFERCINAGT